MHRLILIRHAKSSWKNADLEDHQRPLNRRGRTAAAAVGEYLAANGPIPDKVLCSDAIRTLETWSILAAKLPCAPTVVPMPSLYHASADAIASAIASVPYEIGCLFVVGHNPGLEALAARLAGTGDVEAMARMHSKFPTGALAEFAVTSGWADLGRTTAELKRFVRPRDLD